MVDGAIVDVGEFAHRHPGGSRLILNAVGTDITYELLGEDLSVGQIMSFDPHPHEEVRIECGAFVSLSLCGVDIGCCMWGNYMGENIAQRAIPRQKCTPVYIPRYTLFVFLS